LSAAARGSARDPLERRHGVLERVQRRSHPFVLLCGGACGLKPLLQLTPNPIKHIAHRWFSRSSLRSVSLVHSRQQIVDRRA